MNGHMRAERLEQIRMMVLKKATIDWEILFELINAVDFFRSANAATNDLHVATRERLSAQIAELVSKVNELEQDENPERVFRAEQEAKRLRLRNKEQHEHLRTLNNTLLDGRVSLSKAKADVHRLANLACASAFEHGQTLEELEHYKAQLAGVIKAWDEEREDRAERI
jgi:uncharacterized coiled-coil protein SlyX